jgi:malic enzyme
MFVPKKISQKMQLNAARALADLVSEEELSQKKIIPSPFNNYVVPAVALATATSAIEENIAQKPLSLSELQNNLKSRFKEFEIIGISD